MTAETTSAAAKATAGPRAGRREWIGLAVLALPTLLLSLDMSVLYLALPYLSADLGVTAAQQLWVMDSYGFMIAGFLITMGTLGDRIGRRRLLMIGAAAFGVASVLAAYSSSAEMLIATRAVLGVAGATLMPSTLALISNMFADPHQRGVAVACWMSCFMGGMTVGPLVGGVLLQHFWWGSAFLVGVPVMALLLVAAPVLLPEYRDGSAGRLDLASVVLSLGATLPVIYGLKELATDGWRWAPVVAIGVGVAVGAAFAHRQQQLDDPLLDLDLFRNRSFSAALSIGLVGGIVMAGTFLLLTLYLQMVEGLSPLGAGLWLVPLNLTMAAATMLLVTQVQSDGGLPLLLGGFLLACVGIALPSALGTDLVLGSAPKTKAGSAAAMSETSGEFGIALGVATLGSLGTAVYGAQVDVPTQVPDAGAEVARESITGAAAVSDQLSVAVGGDLLDSAREAFTQGLNIAAAVGAVLFLVLAVLASRLFCHVRPYGETADPEADAVGVRPMAEAELVPAGD